MAQRAKLRLHSSHANESESASKASVRHQGRARAREGTRLVGAHVPIATWRELHALRGELGVTMQELIVEALEDVQAKHRRSSK
jgi:hypothetical protein